MTKGLTHLDRQRGDLRAPQRFYRLNLTHRQWLRVLCLLAGDVTALAWKTAS
jgi:hypothetical protein